MEGFDITDLQGNNLNDFVKNYRDALKNTYTSNLSQIEQQRLNDEASIMAQANARGMMYSNFPERSKMQYEVENYLPAREKAFTSYQTGLDKLRSNAVNTYNNIMSLEDAINDLNSSNTGGGNGGNGDGGNGDGDGSTGGTSATGGNATTSSNKGTGTNTFVDGANTIAEMTGGGQLKTNKSSTYYLVSPNGKKTPLSITKNISGIVMDTPTFSKGGSGDITNYLSGKIKQGYQIQLPGGQNISSTYRITMGL